MSGRSNDLVQGYIYYFGVWEPNLTEFITRRLADNPNRTFVDVGANVGYFSLLAARILREGRVVAIEASPRIHAVLRKNIELNRFTNIRTVSSAATARRESVTIFQAGPENEGATTIVPGKFDVPATIVDGLPLADILTKDEVNTIRLLKIDVEGSEYSVIKGMLPLFEYLPNDVEIVVEITPGVMPQQQVFEMFNWFRELGFCGYKMDNTYIADYYLYSQEVTSPKRMHDLPSSQSDIVFSRVDAAFL